MTFLVNSFFQAVAGSTVTWNPSDTQGGITLSNGNLTATRTAGSSGRTRATVGVSSGKYYFEVRADLVSASSGIWGVGVANLAQSNGAFIGGDANSWAYYNDGKKYNLSASGVAFGATFTTADVIGIAYDMTLGRIWFAKNNTWQASGDPANNTSPAFTGLTGTLYPCYTPYLTTNAGTARFAYTSWTYSAPSGFSQVI